MRNAYFETDFSYLLGPTNPRPIAVHAEPFSTQSSKFSFEYLLLPPRSALKAVSLWLTPRAAQQPSRPPTH